MGIVLPDTKSVTESSISNYTTLIYGDPKSGKTTVAADFPGALFAATEAGHKFVNGILDKVAAEVRKTESGASRDVGKST